MHRLKEKLNIPKAQSFHEVGSLETIVRDSIYLAWPAASFDSAERREPRRPLHRQPDAIEEEDDETEWVFKYYIERYCNVGHAPLVHIPLIITDIYGSYSTDNNPYR